jgi:hypothetical protein
MTATMEVLVVPAGRTNQAPSHWKSETLWFEDFVDSRTSDRVIMTLLAEGIGEGACPTMGDWAAFGLAGGLIAAVTGKQIQFPEGQSSEHREERTWELLWEFLAGPDTGLSQEFIAAILKGFLPRSHHSPPDRPYLRTDFVSFWAFHSPAYPYMSSVGKLTKWSQSWAKEESLARLSPEVVADIKRVAPYIRAGTDYAIACIRAKYRW